MFSAFDHRSIKIQGSVRSVTPTLGLSTSEITYKHFYHRSCLLHFISNTFIGEDSVLLSSILMTSTHFQHMLTDRQCNTTDLRMDSDIREVCDNKKPLGLYVDFHASDLAIN